jgi:hypothetical protein
MNRNTLQQFDKYYPNLEFGAQAVPQQVSHLSFEGLQSSNAVL